MTVLYPFSPGSTQKEWEKKVKIFIVILFISFVGLLIHLIRMQLFLGKKYRQKSYENAFKEEWSATTRGRIKDRTGLILADNTMQYTICVDFKQVEEKSLERFKFEESLERFKFFVQKTYSSLLQKSFFEELEEVNKQLFLQRNSSTQSKIHRCFIQEISHEEMTAFQKNKASFRGFYIKSKMKRIYPKGDFLSHVLGYTCPIREEEIKNSKYPYAKDDFVGCSGIEFSQEEILRGKKGYRKYPVDAKGNPIQSLEFAQLLNLTSQEYEPTPGDDIILTIDSGLQAFMEQKLKTRKSSAAVVIEANTGKILAMASYPNLNQNLRLGNISKQEYEEVLMDPRSPLLNKTIQKDYPPASTFKFIPALLALESNRPHILDKQFCTGHFFPESRRQFRCTKNHGFVDLGSAMIQSCNVFFYHLGAEMGFSLLESTAKEFGYGQKTGIELSDVTGNIFSNPDEYSSRIGESMNTAIGHGPIRTTPLQVAMSYAALVNGGYLYQPYIREKILDFNAKEKWRATPTIQRKLHFKEDSLKKLIPYFRGVMQDPRGTAYGVEYPESNRKNHKNTLAKQNDLAGKTGTVKNKKGHFSAESAPIESEKWATALQDFVKNTSKKLGTNPLFPNALSKILAPKNERQKESLSAWKEQDHAWFVGFSPANHPQCVVSVLVEHGGPGGKSAAPIGQDLLIACNQIYGEKK